MKIKFLNKQIKFVLQILLLFTTIITPSKAINRPIFKAYPCLEKKLPFVEIANLPTPIKELKNLEKNLQTSCKIFLKDDGLCGYLYAGNKPRKLEPLIADALKHNADSIISIGAAGSNYTTAICAYAPLFGLKSIVLLTPQLPTNYLKRNLLLSKYFGAQINFYNDGNACNEAVRQLQKSCRNYYIPGGGSNEIGTAGFVNAAFELKEQIEKGIITEPDYIYMAFGSMGSVAGLILGLKAAGIKSKVIGVRTIYQDYERETAEDIAKIHNLTSNYLNLLDPDFPKYEITPDEVLVNNNFFGGKYALITPEVHEAIKILYESESVKLEGTYTGKAFAALLDDLKNKKLENKTILYWKTNTSGSFEEITNQINYKDLPVAFHHYFEEEVQLLDQGC